jgi:cytochrome c oxidase assembly factor CtaG
MGDLQAFLLSWSFEPTVIIGLLLAVGLYARGWIRLRRRGRGGRILKPWRAWCYGAGMVTVAIALLSPIGTFDSIFFFMHMTQHLLLIMVAAPLIWLGAPLVPTMWAFDRGTRRRLGRLFHQDHPAHRVFHFLTSAGVALTVFILVLFIWHYPPLYDAAQGRSWIHDLEHVMFLGTALLFWWPVIHPSGGRRRLSYGAGILYIFPAKIAGFILGAALTLSSEPYYRTFLDSPSLWGLSPLGDQQLAGLLMWVVGGLLYIVPLLILVLMMMQEDEGHLWVPDAIRNPGAPEARRVAGSPS